MPTRLFGYRAGMNIASLGGTFSRASTKVVANAAGLLTTVASGTLADGHYIGGKRYALLEGARTNLFLQSVFPGSGALPTGWSQGLSTGSQSLVASSLGNADGAQALTLSASAGRQTITQTVTLAASTQYTISVNIEASSGTLSTYVLRVNTNVASVQGAVGGTGSVIAAQGLLQITPGYVGRASLTFTTDATGGSIVIQYGVGTTGNDTGSITISRPQLEAAPFASSYIPTTGATATRAADSLSFGYTPLPQAMTVLARVVEIGSTPPTGSARVFQIGTSSTTRLMLARSAANTWTATHHNGTAAVTSAVSVTPSVGDVCDFRVVLNSDGSVQAGLSVNGGAETLGTASAANALGGAWSATTLALGSAVGGGSEGFIALDSTVVGSGAQPLATMRAMVAALGPVRRRRSTVLLAGGAG